jgi:hypothetical protein
VVVDKVAIPLIIVVVDKVTIPLKVMVRAADEIGLPLDIVFRSLYVSE